MATSATAGTSPSARKPTGSLEPVRVFCASLPSVTRRSHSQRLNRTAWEAFLASYALDARKLEEGWIAGDVTRMRPFLEKVARREKVHVIFWGGSFAMGAGCTETRDQSELDCAWPLRARQWFREAFPDQPVLWENRAWHGLNSRFLSGGLGAIVQDMDVRPDLVVLDFTVNDYVFQEGASTYESVIRAFWQLLPSTQLLLVEDGCKGCQAVLAERRHIARHYSLPVLDYAGMVAKYNKAFEGGPDRLWPHATQPLNGPFIVENRAWIDFQPEIIVRKAVCCPDHHPPWPVHQYYADAMAAAVLRMLGAACTEGSGVLEVPKVPPKPLRGKKELAKYEGCLRPLVHYDARSPPSDARLIRTTGDWALYEDRKDRPGWIATQRGSEIRFPVRVGPAGTIAVTYLRSYEGVGTADGFIERRMPGGGEKASRPDVMPGLWELRYSLPYTQILYAAIPGINEVVGNTEMWQLRQEREQGSNSSIEAVLAVRLTSGAKFKIIAVSSC